MLTHTDPPLSGTIELLNLGSTEADIGGWFLGDDRGKPKYKIPGGTRLQPGGTYLRTEADFNPTPGVPPSFNLSAEGEEVYLFSADASGLTGYSQGYHFGAALNGVSFGRHVISTGEERFVAQAARSLGQSNGLPRVGPIVISEVHYRPPDVFANQAYWDNTEDEFIELCNVSGTTVNLFDPDAPTNTWRLRDAVDYRFPASQTMNPGARLLVVSFDPVGDPVSAAVFRSRYGLTADVRMFGPYNGKLANGSDSVELIQPDSLILNATNITITSVVADKVDYRDDSPWPAGADGLGFSLQRRVESAYGNDPTNWVAAVPSPGAALASGAEPIILSGPNDQVVAPGATVLFRVEATGNDIRYQWRYDGENLPDAIANTLTLTNAQATQSGKYEVVVSTPSRAVMSRAALLRVGNPPAIVQSPLSIETMPGETATFSVIAQSGSPLQYEWRRAGAPLPGASRPVLQLPDVDVAAEGGYDVVVSDGAGFTNTSSIANLTLLGKPVIVQNPVAAVVAPGATATFQVTVTNTAALPITYTWFKDATPVATHTVSSRTDSLILVNVQTSDAGVYGVSVTNRAIAAPGFTSEVAQLILDTDGDGMPDAWESTHSLNPGDASDASVDADRDGASNRDEYLAGTDPHNAASVLKVERIDVLGTIKIRFQGLKSRSYSVLYRNSMEATQWNLLTNIAAISDAGDEPRLIEILDPQAVGVPQRYYRLQTPSLPTP